MKRKMIRKMVKFIAIAEVSLFTIIFLYVASSRNEDHLDKPGQVAGNHVLPANRKSFSDEVATDLVDQLFYCEPLANQ
jgi:hypothetical protein